jgi:hypothetical protein
MAAGEGERAAGFIPAVGTAGINPAARFPRRLPLKRGALSFLSQLETREQDRTGSSTDG